MTKKLPQLPVEIKHKLYEKSVQNHECDIEFVNKHYKYFFEKKPLSFREDFGGTAAMACDWVKQSKEHTAIGIDLDPEPVEYGKKHHYSRLSEEEKSRMKYVMGNVLDDYKLQSDIICAFNFSYFIFKKRTELVEYFKKVRKGLNKKGAFFVDIFGGTEARQELEEETEHAHHSYYWDCESYNPLTNEVLYYIHFKHKGKKYREVFTYDWRMWTVAEVVEAMEEAGFQDVTTFWEGEDEDGDGDGNFFISKKEENCESWVTYIVGLNK